MKIIFIAVVFFLSAYAVFGTIRYNSMKERLFYTQQELTLMNCQFIDSNDKNCQLYLGYGVVR